MEQLFQHDQEAMALVLSALMFAAGKHRDQRRKDTERTPYINHPIQVAYILYNEGAVRNPKVLAAALLHDTVEDTDTTIAEIHEHFGPAVAEIVAEVTDDRTLPKEARKQHQVDHAPYISSQAKLVKLADKISNLRDVCHAPPAGWDEQRRVAYFQWAQLVVAGLRGTNPALEQAFDAVCQQFFKEHAARSGPAGA